MQTTKGKTVLITGANVGIGKDIARQLASRPETARIYLACRNQDRATAAKADLEAKTGRPIFDIVLMDVSDPGSVRAGLAGIDGSLDALVMNAGGMGGKTPLALTADGATYMFAQNVLGHVVLLETLLAENRLGEVAVFAGSEAARGIPKMGFKRPSFDSNSADELATVIDGSYFAGKPDVNLAYGQAKLIGILWMAYLARQHPDRRFICMSPGNTTGTQAPNDLALPLRLGAWVSMGWVGRSRVVVAVVVSGWSGLWRGRWVSVGLWGAGEPPARGAHPGARSARPPLRWSLSRLWIAHSNRHCARAACLPRISTRRPSWTVPI